MFKLKYELKRDEEGEVEPCDCCDCQVPTYAFEKPPHFLSEAGRKRTVSDKPLPEDCFRYCEVCSSTMISSIHKYPEQHREDSYVLQCMAQCTNMILEEIRKVRSKVSHV